MNWGDPISSINGMSEWTLRPFSGAPDLYFLAQIGMDDVFVGFELPSQPDKTFVCTLPEMDWGDQTAPVDETFVQVEGWLGRHADEICSQLVELAKRYPNTSPSDFVCPRGISNSMSDDEWPELWLDEPERRPSDFHFGR